MMCRMFDDTKKRCQEARCEKCKRFLLIREDKYEPLFDIEYGLGIDHQLKYRKEKVMKFKIKDMINWGGGSNYVPIIKIEYGSYVTPYGRISSVYDDYIKKI